MRSAYRTAVLLLGVLALCVALPLLGARVMGHSLDPYSEFPPRTRYVVHPPFSWPAFLFLGFAELLFLFVPLFAALIAFRDRVWHPPQKPFPWWGWVGVLWGVLAWIIAWNRFAWCAPVQRHTFTPLWVGYILVVNGLAYRRAGQCMLTQDTKFFAALFPVSAVFWWLFEYLNRFVQNWYYDGIGDMSAHEYFWYATLPFSTVLPAVLSTYELLGTGFGRPPLVLARGANETRRALLATVLLFAGMLGLLGIGTWPTILFPLLWIAPVLLLAALSELAGEDSLLLRRHPDNSRRLALLAASALICGFFWEMWNYHSLARWVYTVPYVQRFHIFEMPLLGYAGYLPFGLECGLAGILVRQWVRTKPRRSLVDEHPNRRDPLF